MNWMKGASIAVVSAGLALGISQLMRQPVEGQVPNVKLSRTADGKPDLNGIWQAIGICRTIMHGAVPCSSLVPSLLFPPG